MSDTSATSLDSSVLENESTAVSTKPSSPSIMTRIKIGAFVFLIVLVECLLAYVFFVATASGTEARAKWEAAQLEQMPLEPENENENPATNAKPTAEVALGEYDVTAVQPAAGTTLRIGFKLFGTVRLDQQAEFTQQFQANEHRIRDQILIIIRNAELSDLTDPGLGLIKRTISDKINRLLDKPYLETILFSEFSFVEE